ncbi:hypothetical protein O181_081166 [Austropuccinia psidii MF-1]|uniref:NAD(P)-binding protein n=1 Tax=Austropuccinia psidii MF-1 TaxID=1389203 RepID=A0A9Q3IFN5_9BASI|nr:hypothetical protein [Austropuccinia psidii MF-1]
MWRSSYLISTTEFILSPRGEKLPEPIGPSSHFIPLKLRDLATFLTMLLVILDWVAGFLLANIPFLKVRWNVKQMPKLNGRVAVVTGGNTGLGLVTSLELARRGAKVYLACRSETRARKAIEQIQDEVPSAQVEFVYFDLTVLSSAKTAAQEISSKESRLDILINNAGLYLTPYKLSADGIELQACNGTGHFALTTHLLPLLKNADSTFSDSHVRIVNVASHAHMDARQPDFSSLDALNGATRTSAERYGYSKLTNILLTNELQRRLNGTNIYCLSVHPGVVDTDIFKHFFQSCPSFFVPFGKSVLKWLGSTPREGALTQLFAATSPDIETKKLRAAYLAPYGRVARKSTIAEDPDGSLGLQFWTLCESLVEVSEDK